MGCPRGLFAMLILAALADLPRAAQPAATPSGPTRQQAAAAASNPAAEVSPAIAPLLLGGAEKATGRSSKPIHARQILAPYKGASGAKPGISRDKSQALARAQQIERLAQQPDSDFALLAKRYSEHETADVGGLMPDAAPAGEDPAIAKALGELKPGQVSHPVETRYGYFVFMRLPEAEDMPADTHGKNEALRLRGILIAYSGARGALTGIRRPYVDAKEMAVNLRAKALDPTADFEQLASDYSDDPSAVRGGWVGTLTRDVVNPQFADTLFRLQPGEVSAVIESPLGFHIFKREK